MPKSVVASILGRKRSSGVRAAAKKRPRTQPDTAPPTVKIAEQSRGTEVARQVNQQAKQAASRSPQASAARPDTSPKTNGVSMPQAAPVQAPAALVKTSQASVAADKAPPSNVAVPRKLKAKRKKGAQELTVNTSPVPEARTAMLEGLESPPRRAQPRPVARQAATAKPLLDGFDSPLGRPSQPRSVTPQAVTAKPLLDGFDSPPRAAPQPAQDSSQGLGAKRPNVKKAVKRLAKREGATGSAASARPLAKIHVIKRSAAPPPLVRAAGVKPAEDKEYTEVLASLAFLGEEEVERMVRRWASATKERKAAALVHCSERGLRQAVQALLQCGADPNSVASSRFKRTSALEAAVRNGHVSVIALLVKAGASDASGAAARALAELGSYQSLFAKEVPAIRSLLNLCK